MALSQLEKTLLARLQKGFRAAADVERAKAMAAYMRDQFPFYGVMRKQRDEIARGAMRDLPKPTSDQVAAIARACWQRDEREWQYFAQFYARRHRMLLLSTFIEVARELVVTKAWWDTVDDLAQHVVGTLVERHDLATTMDAWASDANFWLVRTAILHQNRYRERTDAERLFAYCASHAGDKEFFIRKAIGWALRVYADTDPRAVKKFVESHALSPLSTKEALRGVARALTDSRAARAGRGA